MNKRNSILALIVLSICVSSSLANDQEKLQESLETWHQAREKNNGDYSYSVRWSSWVGFGHETKILVRDNQVVERHFRAFSNRPVPVNPDNPDKPDAKPEGKSWSEKRKSLGTHKEGAPPKTLDQLYAEAAEIIKRELPQHERRYVRFDKQGLLLSCFTVDQRIADDAPRKGVAITSIELGNGEKTDPEAEEDDARKVFTAPNGKAYPAHWGAPPRLQTRDLRQLPGGYGRGSGTLARWIQTNLDRDAKGSKKKE